MILTYINDTYYDGLTDFYRKNNVKLPVINGQYTIRQVVILKDQYCLLLNEIKNDPVMINGRYAGEPPFHYSRFTDKPGNVLEWETVHEIYKTQI